MRYLLAILLFTIVSSSLVAQESSDTIVIVHDMSQTQDGVTVTLVQTYADTKQIHAWFTIDGMDLPDGRLMGAPIIFVTPILLDYPSVEIGSMNNAVDIDNGMLTVFSTFEVSIPANEMLDVVFNVRVEQPEGMPLYLVPDNVPDKESINPEYVYDLPYTLNISFPVTLNPFQANTILTNFSDESDGLSLSIDEIAITPHSAQIPVCFELPDDGDWQPDIMLEINGEIAQLSSFSLNRLPSPEDVERCTTFTFTFSDSDSVESITITVDGYVGQIPDVIDEQDMARAQERLQGTGIVAEYSGATNVNVISYPDSMLENEAYLHAFNGLRDRYNGYWKFSLESVATPVETSNCTLQTRLKVGDRVTVTSDIPNRVRTFAGLNAPVLTSLYPGAVAEVLDGPQCVNGIQWWYISGNHILGWTAEGQNSTYWLETTIRTVPTYPAEAVQTSSCSLQTRLKIGDKVTVTSDIPNRVRTFAGLNAPVLTSLYPGAVAKVLDGPQCVNGIQWWYISGNHILGWTAEGQDSTYWLEITDKLIQPYPAQASSN